MGNIFKGKALIGVIGALVTVLLFGWLGYANWQRSVRAEGYEYQNNLIALYQGVEVTIGTCLDNTNLSAQIADHERASLKDTLTAVVQARYVDENGNPVDISTPAGQSLMISVIKEAYPDISDELFRQLMTVAVGCRNEVAGAQKRLQAYAADFLTWTKRGDIFTGAIREGFPNEELVVKTVDGEKKGAEALRFITEPITIKDGKVAVETKEMPDQTLFPEPKES